MAWHGTAWLGEAWLGKARHGKDFNAYKNYCKKKARLGMAWNGMARFNAYKFIVRKPQG